MKEREERNEGKGLKSRSHGQEGEWGGQHAKMLNKKSDKMAHNNSENQHNVFTYALSTQYVLLYQCIAQLTQYNSSDICIAEHNKINSSNKNFFTLLYN